MKFSTKNSRFQQNLQKFAKITEKLINFAKFKSGAVQRIANLVDPEKCCKMRIWMQKSALIQTRTSLLKLGVSHRSGRGHPQTWLTDSLRLVSRLGQIALARSPVDLLSDIAYFRHNIFQNSSNLLIWRNHFRH